MTTGLPDRQTDTTVPAGAIKSVSFFTTQESGEPASYHLLVCDLQQGQLMRATMDRESAQRLAQTIIAATGP
jgi:hypothetical protein